MLRYQFSKRIATLLVLSVLALGNFRFTRPGNVYIKDPTIHAEPGLYEAMALSQKELGKDVFEKAVSGWKRLLESELLGKPTLLSIVDLSQSCNAKRLYVIDMEKKSVLFTTYVSHGHNSGEEFAHAFGNELDSYKSSLGFYLTGATYNGAHGLSMRLKGLEKGTNDLAEQRGIVMHGAAYVGESFIRRYGRLGRSQGCPAVPEEEKTSIINKIKEGSCLFIFYPDNGYLKSSAFIRGL